MDGINFIDHLLTLEREREGNFSFGGGGGGFGDSWAPSTQLEILGVYTCVILRDVLYGGWQLVGMDTLLPHGYSRMDIESAHKRNSEYTIASMPR